MVGVGAPMPTSTNTLKVIVTLAVFVGSCKLAAVTVTLVAAVTGVGAVNEFVEVPLASGPEGGPMVAPATAGVKLHATPLLVVPSTSATRFAVCPSVKALELVLKVMLTAPCSAPTAREGSSRRESTEVVRLRRTGILYLNMVQTPRPK